VFEACSDSHFAGGWWPKGIGQAVRSCAKPTTTRQRKGAAAVLVLWGRQVCYSLTTLRAKLVERKRPSGGVE